MHGKVAWSGAENLGGFAVRNVSACAERIDQVSAGRRQAAAIAHQPEHVGQRRRAEVGHADKPQVARLMGGMDRHDVCMLQAGQNLRLGGLLARDLHRDLHGDGPVRQFSLPGKKYRGERTATQFADQLEAESYRRTRGIPAGRIPAACDRPRLRRLEHASGTAQNPVSTQ